MYKKFNDLSFLERKAEQKPERLMILLHGYGSNEQDLFSFAPEMPQNFTILCPRGTQNSPFGGYAWYDIDFTDAKKFNNHEQAQASMSKLHAFIDWALEEYQPENQEVWLGGFSQGCILSFGLSQLHPSVRYGLCMSGYWPQDLLGEIPLGKGHPELEMFISHGTQDAVIPYEWAVASQKELERREIEYHFQSYPAGHGVNPQNFKDLMEWIRLRNPVKSR